MLRIRIRKFLNGLVAGCDSFCLFFKFYNIHRYVHSITFIQYIYPSAFAGASLHFLIACKLGRKNLSVVPSRESNSGLPCSKPTRYKLIHAAFVIYLYGSLLTWDTWCMVSRTPGRGVVDTYHTSCVVGCHQVVCTNAVHLSSGFPHLLCWQSY